METANERLAQAREALGFHSKAEFAKHVGIERSTYDKMEKGPHKPSADNLERIIEREPYLSLNWLLTGQGEMMFDKNLPVLTRSKLVLPEGKTIEDRDYPTSTNANNGKLLTIAEAENVLLRQQLAEKDKQMAKLNEMLDWVKSLVPGVLGKLLSSPEAAHHGQPFGALAYGG